jgi:endothelin-converting enzyme/putative endopeptidase
MRRPAGPVLGLVLFGVAASGSWAGEPAQVAQPANLAIALAARDLNVRPGQDFYRFAGGAWDNQTEIPADQPAVTALSRLHDDVQLQIREILEGGARSPDAAARKAGDLYASWMDEAAIEKRGLAALDPYLARLRDAASADLIRLMGDPAYGSLVAVTIAPDPAQPTRYAVIISPAGLGLPTRDYYLADGEKYAHIRAAYGRYVAQLLGLAGFTDAQARADAIIALETELAKSQLDPARSRDIRQVSSAMTSTQLEALAPGFSWPALLGRLGVGTDDPLIVRDKDALTQAGRLLKSRPLAVWRDYLAYQFIRRHAEFLPKAFDEANFEFFQKTLRGVASQRTRWERGVDLANRSMREAIGRLYAARHFSSATRSQVAELVANIRAAFADELAHLAWMDEATRKEALAKLSALNAQIGEPTQYADYSPLRIRRDDLLGNVVRSEEFAWKLEVARLKEPVDRTRWSLTPQSINARYTILSNQITMPAAVLQLPLFDAAGDPAVNYGALGSLIGHEIGHGFDDQGRRFDASGKLRDWWTPASAAQFDKRAAEIKRQYDAYEALPGLHVNGALTLGENIADLGGLEIAYAAYKRYVAVHGEPPVLDGLTGDQRFFLGFAEVTRAKVRPGFLRELVLRDPHSPPQFRANGPARNVDAWYAAFGVAPGDALYLPPEQRVRIW